MRTEYLETIALIERLHRRCLSVVKAELDAAGVRDLTPIQAMILYNLGDAELTVGELTRKGYYVGTSVSYNVKKLVTNGYLVRTESADDRRASLIRATPSGRAIAAQLQRLFDRQAETLATSLRSDADMTRTVRTLRDIEKLWLAADPG